MRPGDRKVKRTFGPNQDDGSVNSDDYQLPKKKQGAVRPVLKVYPSLPVRPVIYSPLAFTSIRRV